MKKYHQILVAVVAIITIITASSCDAEREYKIGVSQCSQDDWRMKMNEEIEREIMFHEDANVEIRSANDNSDKQIEDIKYFANNGFDIIIVSPNEAEKLTPIIKEIYEKGIPVIIFDRNIIGDSYTARVGVDNNGLGRSVAEYALNIIKGDIRAIEIMGLPGSTPAEGRHEGFIQEFTVNGGQLLASVPANWNKEEAIPVVDSLLRKYDNINLIYAHNDRMAIGASEVVNRLGRNDIKIIGIDAAPNIGIQAVADGVIDATFLYPTEGHKLIRIALDILKGKAYDKEIVLPVSSAVDNSNADILLLQNETVKDETEKMKILKKQIDDYWAQHSSQTSLFYASIVIIALLFGVIFLVLRFYWQHKKHQKVVLEQNKILEEQRDKQKLLNEQLQDAIQSKLMFFTNVSHDLRTPLTLIAEPVAQLTESNNLSPQEHTLIKIADKNVRILKRLINQILDFRKYENDKLTLNLSEIDLGKSIEEWVDSFKELARKRQLKLTITPVSKDADTHMAVDVEKMERIIFNLVSNAFKYTPNGGKIDLSYGVNQESTSFIISVADTGQGIDARDLGNIFDRFYQVDRVHPNGSGIGLSLCKAFVEMHGGTIEAESTLKKGSVFTVTLPITHIEGPVTEPSSLVSSQDIEAEFGIIESTVIQDESKPVLLVIDDNSDIQKLIFELMSADYNIIMASNGVNGLAKAIKYVPDLIICDVMMPVMDGLECCRRLKAEISTSHIPVLMLTACSMDEQRVQGYDSGADGYLSKPFSIEVLLSRSASLIANRKRIKELWLKKSSTPTNTVTPQPHLPKNEDIDDEFYARFLEIFTKEMGNSDLNIDSIASRMGLERTQFYRKIKSLTNFTPVELIRNLRLKQGLHLVKTTSKSVSEIAYEIGFSSPAYFTRCYREAFGETPTDTRNGLTSK